MNIRMTQLPRTLDDLRKALRKEKDLTPGKLVRLLIEADIKEEDLLQWVDYDHDVKDSYGRKPVCKEDNFEIMVMSWTPGDFSAIHDHGHTTWGAVKVFGSADHATFKVLEGQLKTTNREILEPGTVLPVSATLIHQMGNPHQEGFISLHIYGTDQYYDTITGDARLYDPYNNEVLRVDGGVFYWLSKDDIKSREKGPAGDFPTILHDQTQKLNRLIKIKGDDSSEVFEFKNSILEFEKNTQREYIDF